MHRFHPKSALADFGSYEASEIGNIQFRGHDTKMELTVGAKSPPIAQALAQL
jgi:hypothetical protein